MGTWGPGNFENDLMAEHLHEVCNPLLNEVEEELRDPSSIDPFSEDGDRVLANLEIIACLSEHLGKYAHGELQDFLYPCVLPPPETVAAWKRCYLDEWDSHIDSVNPSDDYRKMRREVIIDTFDRVERLARARYDGKADPDIRSAIASRHRAEEEGSTEPHTDSASDPQKESIRKRPESAKQSKQNSRKKRKRE